MRPDQLQRLQELSEKLADVVLEEADPAEWPGAHTPLAALSQQERGDRYWCKKNAAATFALLERTASLLTDVQTVGNDRHKDDEDLDRQIKDKEKEAAKMLERVMKGAKAATRGKA
jgi:hypothetical protein